MRKRACTVALVLIMIITNAMNAFAADETGESIESESQTTSQETEAILEVESETDIEIESEILQESEVVTEAEMESTVQQTLENWLNENYSVDEGIVDEGLDIAVMSNRASGNVLDQSSPIVPIMVPVNYQYAEAHKVLQLVNQIRAENGISPLVWDYSMEEASCIRAAECAISFSHTRPNGESCFTAGPRMFAENIAAGYPSAEAVVNGWMNSPGHRSSILSPAYKSMGVSMAYVSGGGYGCYWSQNFGIDVGNQQYITDMTSENKDVVVEVYGDESLCNIKNFVIRLYENVLERNPDVRGLAGWTTVLAEESNTGAEAAWGFFFSPEFQKRNLSNEEYLDVLYTTILNRGADEVGKAAWKELLETGLSRTYVFHGFAESPEFTKLCEDYGIIRGNVNLTEARDKNVGITQFISRLYTKALKRTPDVDGLNAWADVILSGRENPEKVAFGVLFSDEFKNKKLSNAEYLNVLYRVFMGREADPVGFNAWKKMLDDGWRRDVIFYGFSKSDEFSEILSSFGLQQAKGEAIYVTKSGGKYHTANCSRIRNSQTNILLIQDARSIGYTPCEICH